MGVLNVPAAPCGSCPYVKATPGGVWAADEYAKLPDYDGETFEQPVAPFLCHVRPDGVCKGWLVCHGPDLLAYRLAASTGRIVPAAGDFECDVPLHASGAAAARAGLRGIKNPSKAAKRMILGLLKKIGRRGVDGKGGRR